jgi:putative glutamine amidotransferase
LTPKPIIALPPYAKLDDYETAIRLAGGEPRRLEIGRDDPADVIRTVDALLLPGGGDVDPELYGEERHPTFDPPETGRDSYEMELVRRAREIDMPVLAICRGLQVLNVARGGSLVQDIPSQLETTLTHRRREPPDVIAHDVAVVPGSRLSQLLCQSAAADRDGLRGGRGPDAPAHDLPGGQAPDGTPQNRASARSDARVPVNSRHHQSIKQLGEGLVITATADDGVVEAAEDPSMRFCVAVQWHPENFHRTGEFHRLFEAFVRAARPAWRGSRG